jgi:acyl-CoA hydrolase
MATQGDELCVYSIFERAERLINIAHPDLRDELIREAYNLQLLR